MTRDGGPSSLSNSSSSTRVELREYRLKLTPPRSTVAPNGALPPLADMTCSAESRAEFGVVNVLSVTVCILHRPCLSPRLSSVTTDRNRRATPTCGVPSRKTFFHRHFARLVFWLSISVGYNLL